MKFNSVISVIIVALFFMCICFVAEAQQQTDTINYWEIDVNFTPVGSQMLTDGQYTTGSSPAALEVTIPIREVLHVGLMHALSFIGPADNTQLFFEGFGGHVTGRLIDGERWNSYLSGSATFVRNDISNRARSNNTAYNFQWINQFNAFNGGWLHARLTYQLEHERIQSEPSYFVIREEDNWYNHTILDLGFQNFNNLQEELAASERLMSFEASTYMFDMHYLGVFGRVWVHIQEELAAGISGRFDQGGAAISVTLRKYARNR